MAARLLVGHHRVPCLEWVDQTLGVEQRFRLRRLEARDEALAQQPARRVAAIRIEAETDHRFAVALHIGDDGDDRGGHLAEIDIGVADRRGDWDDDVVDGGNLHRWRAAVEVAESKDRPRPKPRPHPATGSDERSLGTQLRNGFHKNILERRPQGENLIIRRQMSAQSAVASGLIVESDMLRQKMLERLQ